MKTPRTDAAELEANIGVLHFNAVDLSKAYDFARMLELEAATWRVRADAFFQAKELADQTVIKNNETIHELRESLGYCLSVIDSHFKQDPRTVKARELIVETLHHEL